MAPYAKAIAAFVVTLLALWLPDLVTEDVSAALETWLADLIASLAVTGAVWAVPNRPKGRHAA